MLAKAREIAVLCREVCIQMVLMNLFAGQQWKRRYKQTVDTDRARRGWGKLREQYGNIYITVCKN